MFPSCWSLIHPIRSIYFILCSHLIGVCYLKKCSIYLSYILILFEINTSHMLHMPLSLFLCCWSSNILIIVRLLSGKCYIVVTQAHVVHINIYYMLLGEYHNSKTDFVTFPIREVKVFVTPLTFVPSTADKKDCSLCI